MKGSKTTLLLTIAAWVCIPGLLLYWMEMDTRTAEKRLAFSTAKAFFQQVVITRRWNAAHGGVYVPTTPQTPPNQYLLPRERVITTVDGRQLTKVTPSHMTRQMAELARKLGGDIQFHLTSLKPIRPENRPTPWEERWLKSFEQGVKEQGEFFNDGQTVWFRYMAPLTVNRDCLSCHAEHGYKQGDIRGGLSVLVPYPPHTHLHLIVGYGALVATGVLFILVGFAAYERKRRLFEATFNSPVPTCVTGKNYTILMANESYWSEFGAHSDRVTTMKCYQHRPGKSCHTEHCPLARIMAGSSGYTYEDIKGKEGAERHFIITAKPLLDAKGRVEGIVESFQEITDRKRAEEALATSNRKLETLSNTDGLTGIANRRHFDEVLAREYARHARSGASLSLILLDIDHFKAFNDLYGHVAGDECLQRVARVIADCAIRPADLAARYGGEEFACILPETERSGALDVAEKIRQRIMACAIPHQGSAVADHVTASLGVATVTCTDQSSAVEVVSQVDELLYRAKSSGRNRVEASVPPLEGKEKLKRQLVWLSWKDSFNCGHELIDSQHQTLFRITNELLGAILVERPVKAVDAIVDRLIAEARQHFKDEEGVLAAAGFPGIEQHAAEHGRLLAKGRELAEQYRQSTLTVGDVFQFLAYEVIMRHMLEADREYASFINAAPSTEPDPKP